MRHPFKRARQDGGFAHQLADLDVPNESQRQGSWSKVWLDGEVGILLWHKSTHSLQCKERLLTAFTWEFDRSPGRIPNWSWGMAYYSDSFSGYDMPRVIPKDFDWARLQAAWQDGRQRMTGTKVAARAVLDRPNRATSI